MKPILNVILIAIGLLALFSLIVKLAIMKVECDVAGKSCFSIPAKQYQAPNQLALMESYNNA